MSGSIPNVASILVTYGGNQVGAGQFIGIDFDNGSFSVEQGKNGFVFVRSTGEVLVADDIEKNAGLRWKPGCHLVSEPHSHRSEDVRPSKHRIRCGCPRFGILCDGLHHLE